MNKYITRYVPETELRKLLHVKRIQTTQHGAFITFNYEPPESLQMTTLEHELIEANNHE